jgi:choline dehydrogenase-like flavoprotein
MNSKRQLEFDVVVIGSGAGGGTVAKELAPLCKKGAKIALLEWGGRFRKQDNTRRELEMADKYYFDGGGFLTQSQDLTLAFARAVGGSTTVYTGTSLRAPEEVLSEWNVPGVNLADLNPRYDKYVAENHVHLQPKEFLNRNNLLFEQGCKNLSWHVEQFPINTKECLGRGTCNLGCAGLAKQGTNVVQIPKAESEGVEVIPFCRVDRIEGNEVVATVIPPEDGLEASHLTPGEYRFKARKIVISAGTIHSPTLLLRSLGSEKLPALGRYFTCHPAMILVAEHGDAIDAHIGHPKSFFHEYKDQKAHFLLETCAYFPFILSKSLAGFGDEMDEMMGNYRNLQMILLLAADRARAENRVAIRSDGSPEVHYSFTPDTRASLLAGLRAAARLFFASGARRVHTPVGHSFFLNSDEAETIDQTISEKNFKLGKVSITAAHLMGGCRMGEDARTSVTDPWGKVHGQKHLYVADASLFPDSVKVNPYLTIMALSDRVAQKVREDLS